MWLVASACVLGLLLAPGSALAGQSANSSVVGGKPSNIALSGFTVAVLTPDSLCSGSVISSTKILTAAHCITAPPSQMLVVAGTGDARVGGGGTEHGVAAVAAHPGYAETREGGAINDVAVLTLSSPTGAPVALLPSPAEDAVLTQPNAPLLTAGFGKRHPIDDRIGLLRVADVVARTNCARYYRGAFSFDTMVCAQGRRIGTVFTRGKNRAVRASMCVGDSGGPLFAQTSVGPKVLGVVSFGGIGSGSFRSVCGLRRNPGVFTRTSAYLSFIQANL